MISLARMLAKDFVKQRDNYLRLRAEQKRTKDEITKIEKRLQLFGKLLELEGEDCREYMEGKP